MGRFLKFALISTASVPLFIAGCDEPTLSPNGVVHVFGEQGMGPGQFGYPRALDFSADGKLFVVDKTARIQRFDANGRFEVSWSMPERDAGKPVGLAVSPDGRVFVADTHYHRVLIFDHDGNELARFGEEGTGDGQFGLPTDVAVDERGFIYVSEYQGNDRITRWNEKYEFDGVFASGEIEGQVMRRPAAMTFDDEQTLWVADACNHRILRFDLTGRFLHSFGQMGKKPGEMRYPYDINLTPEGSLLVCEYGNCRLQWFDKTGRSLRMWGGAGREIGRLNSPWGAVCGQDGLVYVLDSLNARIQVIKL